MIADNLFHPKRPLTICVRAAQGDSGFFVCRTIRPRLENVTATRGVFGMRLVCISRQITASQLVGQRKSSLVSLGPAT